VPAEGGSPVGKKSPETVLCGPSFEKEGDNPERKDSDLRSRGGRLSPPEKTLTSCGTRCFCLRIE